MIAINKRLGETPLEAIHRLKRERPELAQETLSYAGRLDPMAEGLLLVLVGEENKRREEFLGLDKTYEAEALFGIETDTYDILGRIVEIKDKEVNLSKKEIQSELKRFEGKLELPYPAYSSQPVKGKPLFMWAREEKLSEIMIPTTTMEVYSLTLEYVIEISAQVLIQQIAEKISLVRGDFRQKQIQDMWLEKMKDSNQRFPIAGLKIHCSSGTYVRSIIHELGKILSTGAIANKICRTKIGNIELE